MAFPPPPSSPPPPYYPPPRQPPYPPPTAPPPSAGLIVALAGVLAIGLGMGVLDWLAFDVEDEPREGLRLNAVAGVFYGGEAEEVIGSYEHAYLQHLTWLTASATVLTALLATWPQAVTGSRAVLRGAAAALGAYGLISTVVLAVSLGDIEEGSESGEPVFDVSAGPWVAVAGFALLGLGALLGPPRPR